MALKIILKPGERLVVNGALMRSNGRHAVELLMDTRARVLREAALMAEEQATTPARRLYFAAQLAYVDEANLNQHRKLFLERFQDLAEIIASEEGRRILNECAIAASQLDWWGSLQAARRLISYETKLLSPPQPEAEPAAA